MFVIKADDVTPQSLRALGRMIESRGQEPLLDALREMWGALAAGEDVALIPVPRSEADIRIRLSAELHNAADAHNRHIAAAAGIPYDPEHPDGMVASGIRRAARIVNLESLTD